MTAEEIESRLKAILRHVRSRELDELLRELDLLELEIAARPGGRALLWHIRAPRLVLLVLFRRPLDECRSTVETLLGDPEALSDDVLSAIGTFATHCEDMDDRTVGAHYLAQALERARQTGARPRTIEVYSRLLGELRSG